MNNQCKELHDLFNSIKEFEFPFDEKKIPDNGIYVLFEKGEEAHDSKRIVRIGTHTGKDQLKSRLKQHFVNENKDRSIFRKNIGRALLNKEQDPYLRIWELDLTTKKAKQEFGNIVNMEKQQRIEKDVTSRIQDNFSFVVIPVENKEKRLEIESKIISTVSLCGDCKPSSEWLGIFSPKKKIKENGLWLINELFKEPLSQEELNELKNIINS